MSAVNKRKDEDGFLDDGIFGLINFPTAEKDNAPGNTETSDNVVSEKPPASDIESKEERGYVCDPKYIMAYQNLSEEDKAMVTNKVRSEVDHFVRHLNADFLKKNENVDSDEEWLTAIENLMAKLDSRLRSTKAYDDEMVEIIKSRFYAHEYGYSVIEPLLNDPDISDIKIYSWDDIRVKKLGKRYKSKIKFMDRQEYLEFVSLIMVRNGVGQSDNNAIVKFVDVHSNKLFRLRFDVMTKYVSSILSPYVHIRLVPKVKRSLLELEKNCGMFPEGTREFIEDHVKNGGGCLLTGKNGSGKTTVLNALIDVIDESKSMIVIEDNQELFSDKRGEIMFVHSVESRSENKITYDLSDLAEQALMSDVDVVVMGEVKNDSARGLMKAAYVGVQPLSTSHGSSAVDGYYKLADYVKQATTYDLEDCLRFLLDFNLLVFMKDFKVAEIVLVNGWDFKKRRIDTTEIFNVKKGGWIKSDEGNS